MTSRQHVFPPRFSPHYPVLEGRIQTRSLEMHIVDHCNLTCADCCSLSPLLPPWFVALEQFEKDLALARQVLAPNIFKLVGGEPLLHPEVAELAKIAKRSGIAPTISLTTNGLLLPKMPTALWEELDALTISLYPKPALPETTIAFINEQAHTHNVRLNWKEQAQFVAVDRSEACENSDEVKALYDDCWLRERCHLVRNGYFFTCTRPPHLATAGTIASATVDGISLQQDASTAVTQLLEYFARETPLEACKHCNGGNAPMFPHRLLTPKELTRARKSSR